MRISDWSSDVCSSDLFGMHAMAIGILCLHGKERPGPDMQGYEVPGNPGPVQRAEQLRREMQSRGRRSNRAFAARIDGLVAIRACGRHCAFARSEERRGGTECVSRGRSRWSQEY